MSDRKQVRALIEAVERDLSALRGMGDAGVFPRPLRRRAVGGGGGVAATVADTNDRNLPSGEESTTRPTSSPGTVSMEKSIDHAHI